jgi:hypothetical protein
MNVFLAPKDHFIAPPPPKKKPILELHIVVSDNQMIRKMILLFFEK